MFNFMVVVVLVSRFSRTLLISRDIWSSVTLSCSKLSSTPQDPPTLFLLSSLDSFIAFSEFSVFSLFSWLFLEASSTTTSSGFGSILAFFFLESLFSGSVAFLFNLLDDLEELFLTSPALLGVFETLLFKLGLASDFSL